MRYFLGIDVGSSKTHALIVDENGQCVGFGRSGGGNHQNGGYEKTEYVLRESFVGALKTSGVDKAQVVGAGFGVAGYDFLSDRDSHVRTISALGLSCPFEVVNDGWNGLFAGATRGIGVNITAGSSNNARGRNMNGKEGRIVGNGMQFGEYAGAIEIVQYALQMANYAWIKRNTPTLLTNILIEGVGAKGEADLMEGVSNSQYHLYSSLAIPIFEAARAGDTAACKVVHWAGEELGWLAVSVARQIEMDKDEVEIVKSGSLFEAGAIITEPMERIVKEHCPHAKMIRLDGPPAVGAVILGMEHVGFDGYEVRDEIIRTAKRIVN